MNIFNEIYKQYKDDVEGVVNWCNDIYDTNFAQYFMNQATLFSRMSDNKLPITDSELESILIDIPLNMLAASEQLNKIRTEFEVLKIKVKEKAVSIERNSTEKSQAARKEEATNAILEDSILLTAYESVIDRVEHQISMTRELIMGAKKIWDSRRKTDSGNPVGEVSKDELPEYIPKAYIK